MKTSAAGRDLVSQRGATTPNLEWSKNDWRRWDESHGHVLWMGTLQEDWNNATIAGFFRRHGADITVTRKGQESYCFVEFASVGEAKSFMTKHNHQPLPGKPGKEFNLRPRTRPRWFRGAEHRSSSNVDCHERIEIDHNNRKVNVNGNPRDYGRESGNDERGARKRQQSRAKRKEAVSHQSFHAHQAKRMGSLRQMDCGYYGRGSGAPNLGVRAADRDDRQERSPRRKVLTRQHSFPEHGGHCQVPPRKSGKTSSRRSSLSRSWSRSPPRSRLRLLPESSPPCDGYTSPRSRRSQDSEQSRRHFDTSFRQARRVSDGAVGGGSGNHGSHWVPLNPSAAPRDEPWVDEKSTGPYGRPQSSSPGSALDGFDSDSCVGAKRSITDKTSTSPNARTEGCTDRLSDVETGEVARSTPLPYSATGSEPGVENSPVADNENDDQIISPRGAIFSDECRDNDSCNPKQSTSSRIAPGSGGNKYESTERLKSPPQHIDPRDDSNRDDQEKTSNDDAILEDRPPSTSTTSGNDPSLGVRGVSPRESNHPPSSIGGHDVCSTPMIGLEEGTRSESDNKSRTQDGPSREDKTVDGSQIAIEVPLNQQFDEGSTENVDLSNASNASEAIGLAFRQTGTADMRLAANSTPSYIAIGERGISDEAYRHPRTKEGEGDMHEEKKGRASLETTRTSASRLPPRSASPNHQSPQHNLCQRVGNSTFLAPSNGDSLVFYEKGGGSDQPGDNPKDSSKIGSGDDAIRRKVGDSDKGPRSNGGSGGGRSVEISQPCGSRTKWASPSLKTPSMQDPATDDLGGDSSQNSQVSSPRRGTKRRNTAPVTLAQVMEHHMARRRLRLVESSSECTRADGNTPPGNSFSGHHISNSGGNRGESYRVTEKSSSSTSIADDTRTAKSEASTMVAAAWANGCILPLTAEAASHMRLVAPLFAAEPEGRRIVIHTAAAVATAASLLALPEHHLEVMGVNKDGLLMELRLKRESNQFSTPFSQGKGAEKVALLPALVGQLQATIDGLVALDLEFDMVRLPQGEAMDSMAASSSSMKLLQWLNEGTSTLVRVAPSPSLRQPSQVSRGSRRGDSPSLAEVREALAHEGGAPFLGVECGVWPLLPRTGLLSCFDMDVRPVLLPPCEKTSGGNHTYRPSVVHLAVLLSDTRVFDDNHSGPRDVPRGNSCQSTRATEGLIVEQAHDTESSPLADAASLDLSRLDALRLGCVLPTLTPDGLTWRDVTGLSCVATVNQLALGSKEDLQSKIELAEGLHSAQIEALAKKIALSGTLLVLVAGRQGASADDVASRLCANLKVKGKKPAKLDTREYLTLGPHSARQDLDSAALGGDLAALLGQARAAVGLSVMNNDEGRARAKGSSGVGLGTPAAGWPWCDVVVVYGCKALDTELFFPEGFGLGPSEAISVFVDLVPQVCIDNLTPVNGADVRMLRALLAARESFAVATVANKRGNGRGGYNTRSQCSSLFNANVFFNEWFATEEKEDSLCRSFRATANEHVNTALPHDLNALKPLVEPLLRSVPPPTSGHCDEGGGGDGCRSSKYALARSVLRMLRLCEALPVGGAGHGYPYSTS